MWIEEVMKQHYLWYDQIPEISEKDYFAEPEEFLQKLLYSKHWMEKRPFSYVEMKVQTSARSFLNQTSTYGFDWTRHRSAGEGLTHLCASIVCSSDSPASEAGLQRGWLVSAVEMHKSMSTIMVIWFRRRYHIDKKSIIAGEDDYIWTDVDVLSIRASRPVEINPFYINKVFNVNVVRRLPTWYIINSVPAP